VCVCVSCVSRVCVCGGVCVNPGAWDFRIAPPLAPFPPTKTAHHHSARKRTRSSATAVVTLPRSKRAWRPDGARLLRVAARWSGDDVMLSGSRAAESWDYVIFGRMGLFLVWKWAGGVGGIGNRRCCIWRVKRGAEMMRRAPSRSPAAPSDQTGGWRPGASVGVEEGGEGVCGRMMRGWQDARV
jgi:hypothetical protein